MRHHWQFLRRACACVLLVPAAHAGETRLDLSAATPPAARRVPRETKLQGELRVDPYFWLREKTNPDVITYLKPRTPTPTAS